MKAAEEFERVSLFRLRFRYCLSTVLYWIGTICCVIGWGLVIPTFMCPLFAFGALFFLFMGMMMRSIRTETSRQALLWWGRCALVQFILGALIISLDVNDDGMSFAASEMVAFAILVAPMIFALRCGRVLFGPEALTHKQIKRIYEARTRGLTLVPTQGQGLQEPRAPRRYDKFVVMTVKWGSVVVGVGLVVANVGVMVFAQKDETSPSQYAYDSGYEPESGCPSSACSSWQSSCPGDGRNYGQGGYARSNDGGARGQDPDLSLEQAEAIMGLIDKYGDIGQTDEQIQEKRRLSSKFGRAVSDYTEREFAKDNDNCTPEMRRQVGQAVGGLIESLSSISMGGPEGENMIRQAQECEQRIEQERQAQQFAAELMNMFGQ